MILIVENWEKEVMELAILLDECPSPRHDSINSTLEPWAEGGSLTMCLDSAETKGKADLYLVFRSDARTSWGSRRITAVAGGVLHCDAVPGRGLKFEVVHRSFFGNIVGENTAHPYRVVEEAFLAPDPDRSGGILLQLNQKHPSLGYRVAQRNLTKVEDDGNGVGVDADYGTGVRIKWVDQTGYSEDWFVADEKGSAEFEFLAVEYARRQYVQVILAALGFVRVDSLAQRSREAMSTALLRGIAPQLQALTALLVEDAPTRTAPVEDPRPQNAAVGTASAAQLQPQPLVVAAKFSSRLSPATNANCAPADKAPSVGGLEGANASPKRPGNPAIVQPVGKYNSGAIPMSLETSGRARSGEIPTENGLQTGSASGREEGGHSSHGRDVAQAGRAFKPSGLRGPVYNGAVLGPARSIAPPSSFARANQATPAPPQKRRREESKEEIVELSD